MSGMVVFVAQTPTLALAKVGNGSPFAADRCIDRLARLCNLSSTSQLRERAWLLNLDRRLAHNDSQQARMIAEQMMGRRIVLLGLKVAAAFGLHKLPLLEWQNVVAHGTRFKAARCPHPSNVNQWWNDDANVKRARHFLSEAVWN